MGEIIETAIICSVITLFGLSLGFLFIKMQDSYTKKEKTYFKLFLFFQTMIWISFFITVIYYNR